MLPVLPVGLRDSNTEPRPHSFAKPICPVDLKGQWFLRSLFCGLYLCLFFCVNVSLFESDICLAPGRAASAAPIGRWSGTPCTRRAAGEGSCISTHLSYPKRKLLRKQSKQILGQFKTGSGHVIHIRQDLLGSSSTLHGRIKGAFLLEGTLLLGHERCCYIIGQLTKCHSLFNQQMPANRTGVQ